MNFQELAVDDRLKLAIKDFGFEKPTPIQEKAIPIAMQGLDVVGLAQTGSGKTLAFLIPILNRCLTQNSPQPACLVLAPTRELVQQIADEAEKLLKHTDFKVASIIGGMSYEDQKRNLSQNVCIIAATPGRLIDLIKSGDCSVNQVRYLVLDEADRMFDMGFLNDISFLMSKCVDRQQTLLFSATVSMQVLRMASQHMNDPYEINLQPDHMVADRMEQKIYHLARHEKLPYLVNYLKHHKIEGLGIIFTNFKHAIPGLVDALRENGIPAAGISSQLDQPKRLRLLTDFKAGKYQYLIATDVASRGIDIDNVDIVINFDLPQDAENYVHRIGRTARAGRAGIAISFCSEFDYTDFEKIEEYLGAKVPVGEIKEEYLKFPPRAARTQAAHVSSEGREKRDSSAPKQRHPSPAPKNYENPNQSHNRQVIKPKQPGANLATNRSQTNASTHAEVKNNHPRQRDSHQKHSTKGKKGQSTQRIQPIGSRNKAPASNMWQKFILFWQKLGFKKSK